MRSDEDPGRIETEEVAHVPEWLELAFWTVTSALIVGLLLVGILR